MYGVVTTMCGMAECAAMAATQQCHQEGCWSKTDGVTAVLVRVFWVSNFHGFFGGTIVLDVDVLGQKLGTLHFLAIVKK